MGYGRLSQLFEAEVDTWPDRSMWLRRYRCAVAVGSKGLGSRGWRVENLWETGVPEAPFSSIEIRPRSW
ncbi:MAG: hypothetical protein RLZZ127_646 [Planctomycetota bacterium]|jgi:hypothetical protein